MQKGTGKIIIEQKRSLTCWNYRFYKIVVKLYT
nr:MAG TPA: Protein prenyltransferase alpha subunit repeat [Caudoviricetes sp.]DAY48860.1 MAG TPA: Protein prenyltransferase alpha subunit repeat [Caudoviricetes sp.]